MIVSDSSSSVLSKSFQALTNAMESDVLYGGGVGVGSEGRIEPTPFHSSSFPADDFLHNSMGLVNGSGDGFEGGGGGSDLLDLSSPSTFSFMQMFWTVMFSAMISMACIGNILVIWIVLAHRRMRTTTNYFLVNLSVADLLMAFFNGAPNSFYMLRHDWIFGSILCVVNNFVANFTVSACTFTMTVISCDRYMAIVRPLHPRMTKGATWRAIWAVWTCSAILGLPCLLYSTTQTYDDGFTTKTKCFIQWPDGNPNESNLDFVYNVCLLVLTYVLPMTAMAICYGSISMELWGHRQIGEVTERQINSMISKRKVVKMFVMVCSIFAICWCPYHLYFIYTYYNKKIVFKKWIPMLYLTFYFLAMSTSCSNVLVYYMMNTKFRTYIQQVARDVCFVCTRRRPHGRREFIGETPPLFRHYSQSNSRSRSGTGEENIRPHGKLQQHQAHGNLVLQSHLHHYYHNPADGNRVPVVAVGNRNSARGAVVKNSNGTTVLQKNNSKTCNTYC